MKSQTNRTIQATMVGAALLVGFSSLTPIAALANLPAYDENSSRLVIDEGTILPAKLDDNLSSNNSRKGDTFTATILTDKGDYYHRLPSGTRVEGVVSMVKKKRGDQPGQLELTFRRVRFPNGRSQAIEGSLVSLENSAVSRGDDGRLTAKNAKRMDRMTYVGIGAGAGLIVSLLTKRTLQDTAIGAGLGYLFGSLQKGGDKTPRDVNLKPGTEMGVRVDHSLSYVRQTAFSATPVSNITPDGRDNGDRIPRRRPANRNEEIGVLYGDNNVSFEEGAQPIRSADTVLIPFKPVLKAADVRWSLDNTGRRLTAGNGDNEVKVSIGSRIAVVNGDKRVRLEAQVQRLNGTLYVPLRFLELVTGESVTWDGDSKTVVITQHDNRRDDREDRGTARD